MHAGVTVYPNSIEELIQRKLHLLRRAFALEGVESDIINGGKMDNKGRSVKHKHRKYSVKTSFHPKSYTRLLYILNSTPKPNSDFP
jgi:hypothetical protein